MKEACCVSKVREAIMNNDKDVTSVYFSLANIHNSSGRGSAKTGQAIEMNYNHTMKSGEIRNKNRKSFVSHEYCPFCGKKYK